MENRDGIETNEDEIYCTKGASEAVRMSLDCMIRDGRDGVMIPIPQYPLYSATLTLLGGQTIGYYLDEENQWSQSVDELNRAYQKAVDEGTNVRAMVIINPGNPTGQVLSRQTIQGTVKFCMDNNLVNMQPIVLTKANPRLGSHG
jgi:alanine transaminase